MQTVSDAADTRSGASTSRVRRFAFVIHPLSVDFIYRHPGLRWTRFLPARWVERTMARLPPLYGSHITGIRSAATGQAVEGDLLFLGATPTELMRRDPSFLYRRLLRASRMAEQRGAEIMGLGAFTSVVGDAGITVAKRAKIAITSGNSLTVAAALETAKQAAVKLGTSLDDISSASAMIIGATGSIGSVCTRLLAQAVRRVFAVGLNADKLARLKETIESETPGAVVHTARSAADDIRDADLIVTTTSAIGQRVLDIEQCKPGAVICDIARPHDVSEEDAARRPDVLVIDSGEILLPGKPDFGMDIGLPPGVAYACLAETALLALEGRMESYTLGRNISLDRVKEIYHLFRKHGLHLAGMRSFGRSVSDDDFARAKRLAEQMQR